ncbi:twitching motility protein PilG, partial [Pseudomonas fluorescens]
GTAVQRLEGHGDRRLENDSPHRRNIAEECRLRSDYRHRWFRRPGEDRRPPSRNHLCRHHDAASGWLSDLCVNQEQQRLQGHAGDHAVIKGRAVRQGQGADRRLRSISDQAVQQGRTAQRDPGPCSGLRRRCVAV